MNYGTIPDSFRATLQSASMLINSESSSTGARMPRDNLKACTKRAARLGVAE